MKILKASLPKTFSQSLLLILFFLPCALIGRPANSYGNVLSRIPLKGEVTKHKAPVKPLHTTVGEGFYRDLIIVKFAEGTEIRLRDGQLVSLMGRDLGDLRAVLARHRVLQTSRVFTKPEEELERERLRVLEINREELDDPNLYYLFTINATSTDPEELIDDLNSLDIVEIAYPEAVPQPFFLDPPPYPSSTTPSFSVNQGYLGNGGISADFAWQQQIHGANIDIAHVGDAWNLWHEDVEFFTADVFGITTAALQNLRNNSYHDTAVVGIIKGYDDSHGILGIAHQANIRLVSYRNQTVANTIDMAEQNVDVGGIILLTSGVLGPDTLNGSPLPCDSNCTGGCYYVPHEWQIDRYNAIARATAAGKIVIESAGNGQQDMDNPVYQGFFDRSVRDSGGIFVGAGGSSLNPLPRSPLCFTNYGSRLDVQGWGENIWTTSCDPFTTWPPTCTWGFTCSSGTGWDDYYTGTFGGTSSAAPIVAGAAALVQSYQRNFKGRTLGPTN